MDLREKVKAFIKDTGSSVMNFCKNVGISHAYYYKWIKGQVEFSEKINERIRNFLKDVYAKY